MSNVVICRCSDFLIVCGRLISFKPHLWFHCLFILFYTEAIFFELFLCPRFSSFSYFNNDSLMLYFCIMLVNTISVIKQRKLDIVFFDFWKVWLSKPGNLVWIKASINRSRHCPNETYAQHKKEWIISSYLMRLSMIWTIILRDQHDSSHLITVVLVTPNKSYSNLSVPWQCL